jgi:hypothetical protein
MDYDVSARFNVGGSVVVQSNVYRIGDEANVSQPLGGYSVVKLNAVFRPADHVTLFAFGPVGDVLWPNIRGA